MLAGGSWGCSGGHTFDAAREGYVNLLTGHQKPGLVGDSPEMLVARRRFLNDGYYEPLRDRLVELVAGFEHDLVAEVGCGEGYYIGGIADHIMSAKCLGTDVAKEGVRLAAKRYDKAQFAVADTNKFLPLRNSSVSVLLDIFAPRNATEFRRVMRPGGKLVIVVPTNEHLAELRATLPLMEIQPEKQLAVERTLGEKFTLELEETLVVPLKLSGNSIRELVAMTPNARFVDARAQAAIEKATELAVTAQFRILVFA